LNVTVTALAPAFTMSLHSQSPMALAQGATGTTTITLTANATFNGKVALTCAGAPAEASCTISPTSVMLSGSQTSVATVVIATTVNNNVQAAHLAIPAYLKSIGGVSLACLFLFMTPGRSKRFRGLMMVLLLAGGTMVTLTMSGCGGSSKYPGTTVGNSTLTITATSGSITQTQTISLAVTK
jgi:hypothetical protein